MDERFYAIKVFVRQHLGTASSHGMDHVERVVFLCEAIGSAEGANPDILIPAALLHDIARPIEKEKGLPHEIEGARIAMEYLKSAGYPDDTIQQIAHAIRVHRFSTNEVPRTLEARILSDADKLDAMGATGIARTFMRAGEHGTGMDDAISHFHSKLLQLETGMHTRTARKMATKRHEILVRFLRDLEDEGTHNRDVQSHD